MKTGKKNCNPQVSYNCGRSCIRKSYACRVEFVAGVSQSLSESRQIITESSKKGQRKIDSPRTEIPTKELKELAALFEQGGYPAYGLQKLYEYYGYNGKPEVVDSVASLEENSEEYSSFFARGTGSLIYNNQFREGQTHYAGVGIYGNGSYVAAFPSNEKFSGDMGEEALSVARSYNRVDWERGLIIGGIRRSANLISHTDAKELSEKINSSIKGNPNLSENELDTLLTLTTDHGHVAVIHGYDGIYVNRPSGDYAVLLDRSKLAVVKSPIPASKITNPSDIQYSQVYDTLRKSTTLTSGQRTTLRQVIKKVEIGDDSSVSYREHEELDRNREFYTQVIKELGLKLDIAI